MDQVIQAPSVPRPCVTSSALTTKIHALADQACSPVTLVLPAGQAGDKAYSHDSTGARLRPLKIAQTIPERSDQIARRKVKGSKGVRPPAFSGRMYKKRKTVERCVNRLKHWRAVATRYDKYSLTYLGGVTLAAIITCYRVRN